ncbi:MAG: penicillin-binding protein activator [Candidatus Peregrinibacteria bacterium]|nr:penicillin-binding protein activator [Candidatus Peregrinibacteria bacterium]MDZ4245239.1 penicillin-binding protein activator [Candidatus Gracilibacteria bacterium]
MKKILLSLFTILIAGFVLTACNLEVLEEGLPTASGPQTIKIGFLGPLIGDVSWLGETAMNGVKLAFEEESNDKYTFEMVAEDDQCDPKQGINAYNKLKSDGITALIGPECSSAFLAIAPLAEREQIVAITPSATNADIADAGDFIFRVVASDSFQGKVVAQAIFDAGFKKVAINTRNDAWGQGLTQVFTESFTALGGEVVTTESHEVLATDLKTQLTKIKNSEAKAIYVPTFAPEMIVMLKQMKELGMTDWKVFGGDAAADESVATTVGDIAENVVVAQGKENKEGLGQKYEETYLAAYGKEPQAYSKESYDAARLLAQAIKTVGTDSAGIRDYLYAVQGYQGASGTISFDAKGEMTEKEVGLYTFRDNKLVDYVK